MKQKVLIIGGAILLILLIIRMIVVLIGRSQDVQREFVSKLEYDLSARVDSVGLFGRQAPVGFLYVTITRGEFKNDEKKIGRNLKKRTNYRFLVPRDHNRIEIFAKRIKDFQVGDSLVITSENDRVLVFRDKSKITEFPISENLRGGNE